MALFTSANCATGFYDTTTADSSGDFLFIAAVEDDSTTNFSAVADDESGNRSVCSNTVTYVEDSIAPNAPSLELLPTPPANDTTPHAVGNAEDGSTVTLYATADCSGSAVGTGQASGGYVQHRNERPRRFEHRLLCHGY